jgi:phosphoenolpyruvate carboxykinase (GTP)
MDRSPWRDEFIDHVKLFIQPHSQLPPEMIYEQELLICRL